MSVVCWAVVQQSINIKFTFFGKLAQILFLIDGAYDIQLGLEVLRMTCLRG